MELSIADHTRVLEALVGNPLHMIKHLDLKKHLRDGTEPSTDDVLKAMLKSERVDPYTKLILSEVSHEHPLIMKAADRLSAEANGALAEIDKVLAEAETIQNMIESLEHLHASGRFHKVQGISTGLEIASGILKHGQHRIYEPYPPYDSPAVFID